MEFAHSLSKFLTKVPLTTCVFLILLFLVAVYLRFYLIPQNLFFGPEQGRDFLVVKNIVVNHDFTLIGSKTDIAGIFHGPIYYYLAAVPFLSSKGNPVYASLFFIVINSLTVFLIYYLGKELFNRRVGIFCAILFTISFGAIVYARWLSNPPLSIPLSVLYFLLIYRFLRGNSLSLVGASIVFFLLGDSEVLNYLFYGVITLAIILFFNREFRKHKILSLISLLISIIGSLGNYLLFDLRHDFLISRSALKLIAGGSGYYTPYSESMVSSFVGFNSAFSSFVIPFLPIASSFIGIFGVVFLARYIKKYKQSITLLLLWLLVPVVLLMLLRHHVLEHFFVYLVGSSIITAAFIMDNIWKKTKIFGIITLFLIIGINVYAWHVSIPKNKNIFFQSTQLEFKFIDQLIVIDKIYEKAERKPFSFQAYTIPYWSQEGWEYLFWYHGEKKYGYLPVPEKAEKLFVAIQDDPSSKAFQENWLRETVSKWGTEQSKFRYGALTVKELAVSE
ncbi:MAG: hypothetical protein A2687_01520 [Candidatus Levybacteria bacterium RIFCSPHIGHO2_01_FULL_38_26]|nr:MAG: hypothetical protein A2687_01520 [Candidatus Levybacteria bacterium RIFCSPHIGHO2_01_FULL_38_26]